MHPYPQFSLPQHPPMGYRIQQPPYQHSVFPPQHVYRGEPQYQNNTYIPQYAPYQAQQQSQTGSLKHILEQNKNATRLCLNDMYFGDEGAKLLSEYLKQNTNIAYLELKGNNITPVGFKEITDALRSNLQLKSLILDWNNIGINVSGLECLSNYILENKSLRHLDLRNNKIGPEEAAVLANILRRNITLASLDLRWNELTDKGGKHILAGIKDNTTLCYLELNGNNINNDILQEIQQIIDANKNMGEFNKEDLEKIKKGSSKGILKNNRSQENSDNNSEDQYYQQGLGDQQKNPQFDQSINDRFPQNQQQQINDPYQSFKGNKEDPKQMIIHLEHVIDQERKQSQQIKSRLDQELESYKRKDKNDTRLIQDFENRIQVLLTDNSNLKNELERLREEMALVQNQHAQALMQQEDRIRRHDNELDELEKRHRITMDKLINENAVRYKDIQRDWEQRTRSMEERIKNLQIQNEDLNNELKRVTENSINLKVQHEEDLRALELRIHEDEYNKYKASLKSLEARMMAIEEGREMLNRKNSELVRDLQIKEKKNADEMYFMENELIRLKAENQDFNQRNKEFELLQERLKNDLRLKDNMIEKLELEVNELNDLIELKKEEHRQQLDKLIFDHKEDKAKWDDQRDIQQERIQELERALRSSHSENLRLKQDYQRLAELLQSSVNKAIFSTFSENQYF